MRKTVIAIRIDPDQHKKILKFMEKSGGKIETISHFIRLAITEKLKRKR